MKRIVKKGDFIAIKQKGHSTYTATGKYVAGNLSTDITVKSRSGKTISVSGQTVSKVVTPKYNITRVAGSALAPKHIGTNPDPKRPGPTNRGNASAWRVTRRDKHGSR